MNKNIEVCILNKAQIKFFPKKENEVNDLLETIAKFGKIITGFDFQFKEGKTYILSNNETIATKNNEGNDKYKNNNLNNSNNYNNINKDYINKFGILINAFNNYNNMINNNFNNMNNNMYNNMNMNNNMNINMNNNMKNNMNFNMNNNMNNRMKNFMNNYMNNNMNNFGQWQNNNGGDDKDFIIFFKYKQKEFYLDLEPDIPLIEALKMLSEKYCWMSELKIKGLRFKNQNLNLNLSCYQLGITNESKIEIID